MPPQKDDWDQENGEEAVAVSVPPAVVPGATHAQGNGKPPVSNPAHPPTKHPPIVIVDVMPKDLIGAFALLKKITALPEGTKAEKEAKAPRLAAIRKHVALLQNGPAAPVIGANQHHTGHLSHNATIRRTRLENMARQDRDIEELLRAFDAMALLEADDQKNVAEKNQAIIDRDTAIARLEGVNEQKIIADGKVNELTLQNEQLSKDLADFTGRLETAEANRDAAIAAKENAEANVFTLQREIESLKTELEKLKPRSKK